jgi:hypothetical protein
MLGSGQGMDRVTLVALPDRVDRIRLAQDLGGIVLGVLLRHVAQHGALRGGPVAARVGRYAPGDQEPGVLGLDAAHGELQQVVQAEPGAEVAELGRLRDGAADAHADALDLVLFPIKPGHAFAPHLAQPVEPVRPEVAFQAELGSSLVHADGVVRAGEDDPLHLVPARAFIDRLQPDQVVLDDLRQRALDRRP